MTVRDKLYTNLGDNKQSLNPWQDNLGMFVFNGLQQLSPGAILKATRSKGKGPYPHRDHNVGEKNRKKARKRTAQRMTPRIKA
jgi:hypothetical protein